MPTCRHCGDDFGNKGALANHERACSASSDGSSDAVEHPARDEKHVPAETSTYNTAPPADPQPGQPAQGQAQPPARQGQSQQQGALPANQGAQESIQTGAELANAFTKVQSDDPRESAEGTEKATKAVAGFVYQWGKNKADEKRRQAQRAQQDGEVKSVEDVHRCPECEYPLQQIPEGAFNCPNCHEPLEFVPVEG